MSNKRDSSTSQKALRGITWTWPMDSRSQVNDKDLYKFPRPIKLVIFRISASWWLPTTKTADCGDWARAEERWSRRAVGPTPGRWHWSLIVISLISSTLFPSISCFCAHITITFSSAASELPSHRFPDQLAMYIHFLVNIYRWGYLIWRVLWVKYPLPDQNRLRHSFSGLAQWIKKSVRFITAANWHLMQNQVQEGFVSNFAA